MPVSLLLQPDNRFLSWSINDFALFGAQTAPVLSFNQRSTIDSRVDFSNAARGPGDTAPETSREAGREHGATSAVEADTGIDQDRSSNVEFASRDSARAEQRAEPRPADNGGDRDAAASEPRSGPGTPSSSSDVFPSPITSGTLGEASAAATSFAPASLADNALLPSLSSFGLGTGVPVLGAANDIATLDFGAARATFADATDVVGTLRDSAPLDDVADLTDKLIGAAPSEGVSGIADQLNGIAPGQDVAELTDQLIGAQPIESAAELADRIADGIPSIDATGAATPIAVQLPGIAEVGSVASGALADDDLSGLAGADPAAGVATLVELVETSEVIDFRQVDTVVKSAPTESIVDALAMDEAPSPLLGDTDAAEAPVVKPPIDPPDLLGGL